MYQLWYILYGSNIRPDNLFFTRRTTSYKEALSFLEDEKILFKRVDLVTDNNIQSFTFQNITMFKRRFNELKIREIYDRAFITAMGIPYKPRITNKCIKDHRCRLCGSIIKKGSTYITYTSEMGFKNYQSIKVCKKCADRIYR